MMLGTKRASRPSPARHPMRRTTSMIEFAPPDVLADVADEEADEETELQVQEEVAEEIAYGWIGGDAAAGRAEWLAAYRACSAPSLVGHRRNSADFSAVETAAFLRACSLCNRRLGPGRDTFMYRGDTAFCSLECRQQHMTHEEWKEKRALATPPPPTIADPVAPASAGSDKPAAAAGGTLAAA